MNFRVKRPVFCLLCFFLFQVIPGMSSEEHLSNNTINGEIIPSLFKSEKQLSKKPENINPEISKKLVSFIREKSKTGTYRVEVKVGDKVVPMDVFPTVFPPQSNYSASSKSAFETFKSLESIEVADIGTGSGIESIVAVMAGANHVDACDINQQAIDCAKHNVKTNNLQNKIEVFKSDLFKNFPQKKYDLIIANLPIVNFDTTKNYINDALYDKDFKLHKRFFSEVKSFLKAKGVILIPHANLQSAKTESPNYDFQILEKLINESGYEIVEKAKREELGYAWINYKIKLKK